VKKPAPKQAAKRTRARKQTTTRSRSTAKRKRPAAAAGEAAPEDPFRAALARRRQSLLS
jgi:hypothetical protein